MSKKFTDPEFGEIAVSFRSSQRSIRLSMGTDGRLQASAPLYTPIIAIKTMINASRPKIRDIFMHHISPVPYTAGQQIGKSHRLIVVPIHSIQSLSIKIQGQNIMLRLPQDTPLDSADIQRLIRDTVAKALRAEAKAYLPRRLKHLAALHGFSYERVRFSHAGTRWGSCSSTGTISLNIALMKLPSELIDYVLIHELAHTRHMNHSPDFWNVVAEYDANYKKHRKLIKLEHPMM